MDKPAGLRLPVCFRFALELDFSVAYVNANERARTKFTYGKRPFRR